MLPSQPMNFLAVTAPALPEALSLSVQEASSGPVSFVMPDLPLVAVSTEAPLEGPVNPVADNDTPAPDDVTAQLAQLLNLLVPQETQITPVAVPVAELTLRAPSADSEMPIMQVATDIKQASPQTSAALATAASVAQSLSQPGAQNTLKPLAMSPALASLVQHQEGAEKPLLTATQGQPPTSILPVSFQTAQTAPDIIQSKQDAVAQTLNMPLNVTDGTQIQGEKLRQVLGDRLQLQLDNRVQHATIRLDPPELGKIDISLQLDANKLNVQIQAGQPEVARALQQVSHELRQALTAQNNLQVQVNISSQQQPQQQGQHPPQTPYQPAQMAHIASAARSDGDDMSSAKQLDASILTTV